MPSRLNKFLVSTGLCSRKKADIWIQQQRITVNDLPATLGQIIEETDVVKVDGETITISEPLFYLYYKPKGVVCTHDLSVAHNLVDSLPTDERLFSVGRLDKDSEGLLLLTNQGDLANRILQPDSFHQKTYRVQVDKPISDVFLKETLNNWLKFCVDF